MRWVVIGAIVGLALPLAARAEMVSDNQSKLEEALRQQQMICSGMLDVSARGGAHYSGHQLAQCLVALQELTDRYHRVMAAPGARLAGAATASFR